ncbi:hypothetical protein MHAS_01607 [Mycolicibacterium hassiacum DSM 44199]|jgi:hypothetical protein|nr:DUF2510 domain-containing protein [Mycolicibacterium hassiacum]VCT89907.1 hypothetical protein MHAS_01607 [Mycolicibacterium hassiacum DSM 44199]
MIDLVIAVSLCLALLFIGVVVGVIALVVHASRKPTPTAPPTGQPPGWYPDPHDASALRYFDGRGWTEHVQRREGPST